MNDIHPLADLNGFDINVLYFGHLLLGTAWSYSGITSPFDRFYWIREGEAEVRWATGAVRLRPGHAYLIPAGLTCDYHCDGSFRQMYIHANVRHFGGTDLFHGLGYCLEMEYSQERMAEMVAWMETGTMASMVRFKASAMDTAAQFLALTGRSIHRADARLERQLEVMRIVAANPALATPASIAASLRIQTETLERSFRRDVGMTLRQYIRERLVEEAKIRLQATTEPVREIASSLGYEDEFYFSRLFSRQVGVAPSHYRERNRME